MESMGFFDACSFFPYYTSEEKVLAYSVLGGIPRYLKQFEPTAPLFENIKKKILTKGSVLYSEADFALHKELREVAVYNSIMERPCSMASFTFSRACTASSLVL